MKYIVIMPVAMLDCWPVAVYLLAYRSMHTCMVPQAITHNVQLTDFCIPPTMNFNFVSSLCQA